MREACGAGRLGDGVVLVERAPSLGDLGLPCVVEGLRADVRAAQRVECNLVASAPAGMVCMREIHEACGESVVVTVGELRETQIQGVLRVGCLPCRQGRGKVQFCRYHKKTAGSVSARITMHHDVVLWCSARYPQMDFVGT